MAHNASLVISPRDAATPADVAARRERRFLRRLYRSLAEARQRHVDRQIERYLEGTGGKLTDAVEREILRRVHPDGSDRIL